MKFLLTLSLCALAATALAAAAPKDKNHGVNVVDSVQELGGERSEVENRNILINMLIRQLIAYIRNVINNGSNLFAIPPLDPLELDNYRLQIPAGLINLDLGLKNAVMTGIGGFVVHKSDLDVRALTFDIDISVPELVISSEVYDLDGDILTAIPIYGNGKAEFVVKDFRLQAKLYLGQSEDEKSVILHKIEGAAFQVPYFKSNIEGAIGGGDIDKIVNVIVEDVIVGYVNRFQGAISKLATKAVMAYGNSILELLDTWRFIAPFV